MPLQIFDLKDTNVEAKLIKEDFSKNAQCLAFLPDNKHFFSSGKDKKIILWDIESGENEIFAETSSGVSAICADSAGRSLIVGTDDGKILVYELAENEHIEIGENGNDQITAISISKDGNYMVTGYKSGNIALWNYLNLDLITVLKAHSSRVTDLKFSPAGDVFASSGIDNKVLLWSIESYSKGPILLENHDSPVLSLSFNDDGNTLLIGSENEDRIIAKPVNPAHMADMIKQKMIRNLSWNEWDSLIGKDIAYEKLY
jgi:WD40 repeat protein